VTQEQQQQLACIGNTNYRPMRFS